MSRFTRTWLRSFLQLGARTKQDGVPLEDVERQEDTVLQSLRLLETRPGIVLADEVGMGKTFEALGVIAAMRQEDQEARVCIVTPGPDLNKKWLGAVRTASQRDGRIFDFGNGAEPASSLSELVHVQRRSSIALVPVSAFQGARGGADQAFLLSLFARWKALHGTTTNAIFKRYREGKLERVDPKRELFLDTFPLTDIEPHLEAAFISGSDNERGLHELFELAGIDAFEQDAPVKRAIDMARFRLVRALMPSIRLLVIDEAHKLKNAESLRYRAVSTVFDRKFDNALFLTATPFQLHIEELRQVFTLFARARTARPDLERDVEALFTAISRYQDGYDQLETQWRRLDAAQAAVLADHYRQDPLLATSPTDPTLGPVVEAIRGVRTLKQQAIEPGFRNWMVRSIHQEKRDYRRHIPETIEPSGDSLLPFLVYERFIAELFRTADSTHKAAVEVNMVSSFEAAANGSLFDEGRKMQPSADAYRKLLEGILATNHIVTLREHPKVQVVVRDAIAAAERGEKTLIFCGRTQTISQLGRELDAAWNDRVLATWRKVYPDATDTEIKERHDRLNERMHRSNDRLHMALRERYLQTLVPASAAAIGHEDEIAARATELLHSMRVGMTAATRIDYKLAKRCIERAIVERWSRGRAVPEEFKTHIEALTSDAFLRYGADLTPDKLEGDDEGGEHTPTWTITGEHVDAIVTDRPHLWHTLWADLRRLTFDGASDMDMRVKAVERLARYLTRFDVLFLPELLLEAQRAGLDVENIHSEPLLEFIDDFWASDVGASWVERLREFLRYFNNRPRHERQSIIDGPIASGHFVRHTVESETREELREAFNTPLNPMVLIANEVMQEGLDLHHNCRRIVHHDLAWNPAQLEQRVGRIDRLGSLIRRKREVHRDATLDIAYPLIARTIDERMYRTVKAREKWLEFLLGARPSFNEYGDFDEPVPELPKGLAESLAVDLRPPKATP